MPEYQAPIADMKFVLRELVDMDLLAQLPGFAEMTPDVADAVLDEAAKFAAAVLSPLTIFGKYIARCDSVPRSSSASIAPRVSMGQSANATLAPFHISSMSAESARGKFCPPNSAGQDSAFQPSAAKRA